MNELTFHSPLVDLNYVEGPKNGSPMLLLHGSSSRWQTFTPIIPNLMPQFHLFAADLRGHGKSGRVPGYYRLQDYLADIAAMLEAIINKPTVIFGHSLGGMLAIMAAAHHPELIKAIIVGDAPLSIDSLRHTALKQSFYGQHIIKLLKSNQTDIIHRDVGDQFTAESLIRCDPDMLASLFDRFDSTFSEYQVNKLLPLVKCPILIIRGNESKGSLITNTDIENAAKLAPHLTHVSIPEAGHSIISDDTTSVFQAINSFQLP